MEAARPGPVATVVVAERLGHPPAPAASGVGWVVSVAGLVRASSAAVDVGCVAAARTGARYRRAHAVQC